MQTDKHGSWAAVWETALGMEGRPPPREDTATVALVGLREEKGVTPLHNRIRLGGHRTRRCYFTPSWVVRTCRVPLFGENTPAPGMSG